MKFEKLEKLFKKSQFNIDIFLGYFKPKAQEHKELIDKYKKRNRNRGLIALLGGIFYASFFIDNFTIDFIKSYLEIYILLFGGALLIIGMFYKPNEEEEVIKIIKDNYESIEIQEAVKKFKERRF